MTSLIFQWQKSIAECDWEKVWEDNVKVLLRKTKFFVHWKIWLKLKPFTGQLQIIFKPKLTVIKDWLIWLNRSKSTLNKKSLLEIYLKNITGDLDYFSMMTNILGDFVSKEFYCMSKRPLVLLFYRFPIIKCNKLKLIVWVIADIV
jgi:hypothetical protein